MIHGPYNVKFNYLFKFPTKFVTVLDFSFTLTPSEYMIITVFILQIKLYFHVNYYVSPKVWLALFTVDRETHIIVIMNDAI